MFRYVLLIALMFHGIFCHVDKKFEIAFEWNYVNFTWPNEALMEKLNYTEGAYIPVGIKAHEATNKMYIALPRSKTNARIVLASIPLDANKRNPLLTPFPSWEMNTGSSCETLQDLISMEIDPNGIMWVLDGKRTLEEVTCPPKVVLLDLNENGRVIQSYIVPEELCSNEENCYLNDLVVDGNFMYSSDFTTTNPGIFIYNRKLNKSWKAVDNATMYGDIKASTFVAQGVLFNSTTNINGIALSPPCSRRRTFFYTPQTSFHIYSIPTEVLKDESLATGDISEFVQDEVKKPGATGGMICDSKGNLYFGLLPQDAVAVKLRDASKMTVVEQNSKLIKWPDTFAFDQSGNLFLSATQILRFNEVGIDSSEVNFRILKLHTGTKNYFHCEIET